MSQIDLKKVHLGKSIFLLFTILWGIISIVLLSPSLDTFIEHSYMLIFFLFILFCFFGLTQYLFLKIIILKAVGKKSYEEVKKTLKKDSTNLDSHLFFYLLSVLQKKGRFLDFISEDLALHKDTQIGVTARLVHKNCKEAMGKYFVLEHIIKEKERENITLSNFDRKAIELIGNVVGDPPYSGIVRHKGWRGKLKINELPKFAAKLIKLNIIYPAQIEVL